MFKSNFVVSLKQNGSILRERDGVVYLPFGSEYSIFLKNLESRKASVKVSVDGEDALDSYSLLINPNSSMDLKGFLKETTAKNKFRFIEKTKEISDYRGDKVDDGLVRVEFTFEKEVVSYPITTYINGTWSPQTIEQPYYNHQFYCNDNSGTYDSKSCLRSTTVQCSNVSLDDVNTDGITVKGSEINQRFQYGSIGTLEENSHVIILKLKGIANENIKKPVFVSDKLVCSSCGKKSSSNAKFCDRCGTFLEI